MSVWLATKTLLYAHGGGHLWVYLNWALSLREAGCDVVWFESIKPDDVDQATRNLPLLQKSLSRFGFEKIVVSHGHFPQLTSLESAVDADLLVNIAFDIPESVAERFRRSAFIDIDPGQTQVWMSQGKMHIPSHTVYYSIGETVGTPLANFPDCGLQWNIIRPPVFLGAWETQPGKPNGAFTTVSHWWGSILEHAGESYRNGKRDGFLPYHDLPLLSEENLEIAVSIVNDPPGDRPLFEGSGWRIVDPYTVAGTPEDYREYIVNSKGEFSCAKPCCLKLNNAWISDRTICYLATGRPAVVQYTGPSQFLPDSQGLFRFKDKEQAVDAFRKIREDYSKHCRTARSLAEEYFDGVSIVKSLLSRVLS